MSSLSLFARRTALSLASRRFPVAPVLRVAMSTRPKDYFNATSDDTNAHDQFQMLESLLEDNFKKADASRAALRRLIPMAVDGPDGEPDAEVMDDLRAIQFILEDVAVRKEEIMARLAKIHAQMEEAKKTFAVDSPDGEVDGHTLEEITEINHIIDDAAAHEDTKKIKHQHKMDDAVRKDRARDPEHDW